MSEIAIGIDLGTSNSCVAVLRKGEIQVLPNAFGEATTPSVVSVETDGSIVVGNPAKANIIHDPANTIYSSKRLIGRYFFSEEVKKARAICSYKIVEGPNHGVRIRVRDEEFSLPEVSAMILRELKNCAEASLGQAITKAVITVPANFNDNQRQATKDAGRIAGLEVLRILNEPTAAALAYGFGKGLSQTVAVYDLGGGTFDISILEIGEDVYEVLSTCGDTFLGGDDFDDRVIDLLADEFAAQHGINLRKDPYALEKLKLAAENAKRALSIEERVEIRIPDIVTPDGGGAPLSVERTLTRAEFDRLIADLIQRTFKVCDEAMQQADLVVRDLDGVILVGGPTRLPVIREAVQHYFQKPPREDVDPDQVVAIGAAIHAASLIDQGSDTYLLDVTPLTLRIGVAGGLAEPIIDHNTPVPIEQSRTFTTVQDDQESVVIRVYQGESRKADENELLGQFEFGGFKKARRGQVSIEVAFAIDADGIVDVKASDPETGQQASTQISLSSGLSEHELSHILEEKRTDRVRASTDLVPANSQAIGAVQLVQRPAGPIPQAREALDAAEPELLEEPPTAEYPSLAAVPALEVDPQDEDLDLLPDEDLASLDLADPNEARRASADYAEIEARATDPIDELEIDPDETTERDDLFDAPGTVLREVDEEGEA